MILPRTIERHHTCGCGRHYTRAEWERLKLVAAPLNYCGSGMVLEMRDCPACRSTMSVCLYDDEAVSIRYVDGALGVVMPEPEYGDVRRAA